MLISMKKSCKFLDFPPRSIQNGFVHRFHSHFAALLIAWTKAERGRRGHGLPDAMSGADSGQL